MERLSQPILDLGGLAFRLHPRSNAATIGHTPDVGRHFGPQRGQTTMTRGKRQATKAAARERAEIEAAATQAALDFAARTRTPLAPGDPRLHHYVPQLLLRGFADERERITTIRLASPHKPLPPTSIAKTAAIRDFYTIIDKDVGETVAVEKLLAEIEGIAHAVLTRLTASTTFAPSLEDRRTLALFVSLQLVRGPGHRRMQEAFADHAIKLEQTLRENRAMASGETNEDMLLTRDDVEYARHQNDHVKLMLECLPELAPHIESRYVALLCFAPGGLVITDEPVTLWVSPRNHNPHLGVGVATADEIWLPIDRHRALVFHSDEVIGNRSIDVSAQPNAARDFNQTTVNHAFAEVYAHPDDAARVLAEMVWPDPNKPVMTVNGAAWVRGDTDGLNEPPRRKSPRRYRAHSSTPQRESQADVDGRRAPPSSAG